MKLCSVECCENKAIAKGLCNGHYLRKGKGKELDSPIQERVKDRVCKECDEPVGSKGGWGYCDRHYRKAKRQELKNKVIEHFGGKCSRCKNSYPSCVYDLHHKDPSKKEFTLGNAYLDVSNERFWSEVNKCELLCANCHRIEHAE